MIFPTKMKISLDISKVYISYIHVLSLSVLCYAYYFLCDLFIFSQLDQRKRVKYFNHRKLCGESGANEHRALSRQILKDLRCH